MKDEEKYLEDEMEKFGDRWPYPASFDGYDKDWVDELAEECAKHFYELGKTKQKAQMMNEDYPKWRRIKAGERLPCPAYVWTIAYDNYPDCFEGRLMPNIEGVKVGRDTWYLPVDVIHNLPKED